MSDRALPAVDLVVSTRDRGDELERLLGSLVEQRYPALRVIVVDQNDDDRAAAALARFSAQLDILHVRSPRCGVSRAKNTGLAHANAEIIGLPDDDCWYPPGVLNEIAGRFARDPALGGLTVVLRDEGNRLANGRWARRPGPVTRTNVWSRGVGSGMFFRKAALEAAGPHDETLGRGSGRWEAGEETDILIRVVGTGHPVWYEPSLFIHHPDPERDERDYSVERWGIYAAAMGHVMRLHDFPRYLLLYYSARPGLGAGLAFVRGQRALARRRVAVARGRLAGWRAPA